MRAKSWTIHLRAISGIANSWDAMSFAGALRAIASRSHNGATSLTLQAGAIFLASSIVSPIQAQLPLLPDLNLPTPNLLNQNSDDQVVSGCIRLDGRCLFKIADQKSDLPNRITGIEQRLNDISRIYFNNDSSNLKIRKQKEEKLPNIYISVADKEVRLLEGFNDFWCYKRDCYRCLDWSWSLSHPLGNRREYWTFAGRCGANWCGCVFGFSELD
jgi:hypothetical protein